MTVDVPVVNGFEDTVADKAIAALQDEGYTVTAISDPETALAFLAESEVDVVVTDMKMPKVSGREVLQHVKKSWPYIPVLIMTAFGSIETAVRASSCARMLLPNP